MDIQEVKGSLHNVLQRLAFLAVISGGLAFLIDRVKPKNEFIFWLFIYLGASFFLGSFLSLFKYWKRKYVPISFYVVVITGVGIMSIPFAMNSCKTKRQNDLMNNFEVKMQYCRWMAYEPIHFNPYHKNPAFGSINDIKSELSLLFQNGCTGIITFGTDSILSEIPRISRALRGDSVGVIMGITDVRDMKCLNKAIEQSAYVDAYCVGHMFTDYAISENDVLFAINYIKRNTDKPVTTTLRPLGYKSFIKISSLIDWFFPDIHGNWYANPTSEKIFQQTKEFIDQIKDLQNIYPNKPFLLKMISYPSAEVENASVETQYNFFRLIVEYTESNMEFPDRIYPSYFSGFDLPWKTQKMHWPPGERYLGFFDTLKNPKYFIKENNKVTVISALDWSRIKADILRTKKKR